MKSKKIYLEVTPFFPTPTRFYGPYIYDQVKAIERNSNYEVIVIKTVSFFDKYHPKEHYEYNGVKVYVFKVLDLPFSLFPGLFKYFNEKRFLKFLKKKVQIDTKNIEVVHSHTIYPAAALAVLLKKEFKVFSVAQHHGLDVYQLENGRLKLSPLENLNKLYKLKYFSTIANNVDVNIGVSNKVLEELNKNRFFKNKSVYTLYNGVDKNKFFKKSLQEKKPKNHFIIGCIGNFWPLKDHMTLLKSIKLLKDSGEKDIYLKLIGSGPTLTICKEFIEKENLSHIVSIEKEVHHDKLNDFYNSLDLFVLPSYYEAFGCVYTEALQCGVPIIAVKGQGIEEVLKDDDKKTSLIEKGDYKKLSELIRWNKSNKKMVKYDFDIDHYISEYLKFLNDLLAKGNLNE